MSVTKKVKDAGLILGGLGVIGFIGIVWLMIYGNLSGNLGFTQDTTSFINETINLTDAGAIPTTADGRTNPSLSNVRMYSESGGELILAGNYTLTIVTFTSADAEYNSTGVNISATVTYDSAGQINTEGVIGNVTTGFSTFFGFSNTFFTIAAIVLLIFMLVGLLAIVMQIAKGGKEKKSSGYSGY